MNPSQERQEDDKEKKEKAPSPEKESSARETGERMKREGGRMTDDVMANIDDAWEIAEAVEDPSAERRLEGFKTEAVEAKTELDKTIEEVDSGWGDEESPAAPEARTEEKEPSPEELEAAEEAGREARDLLDMDDDYFDSLERVASLAAENKANRKEILDVMREKLGNKAAELLDSPELRKDLAEMKERLSGRWGGENGPPIASELSLLKLVALKETLGKNPEDLLGILDIKGRIEKGGAPGEMTYFDTDAINVGYPEVDPETGEIVATVEVGFKYDDPSGESMAITREFKRVVETDKEGKPVVKKYVEHSLFELPSTFKANGLAADITRESLASYDEQGIDEIKLKANIDMGGYAWAAYGYGWDKKGLAKDFMKQSKNGETEVSIGGQMKKIKDLSAAERRTVLEEQPDVIALEAVANVLKIGRGNLENAFSDAGLDPKEALAAIDAMSENALTVTPQSIAEMGRSGPQLYRSNEMGKWFTEKGLDDAVAAGDLTSDDAASLKKKPYHAGKIALQNNTWYGTVQLKEDADQGGANRKLLENYLAKAAKKKG